MNAFLEILQHVITGPHGEGDNRHRRGLVGGGREDAGVANVEIRHVVSLRPLVCDRRLGVIPKPTDSDLMQAGSWTAGLVVGAPHFSIHRFEEMNHHLL